MFSFTKEQKVFDISGISIGGQPGMYPTVLFGGLFFKGEPDFDDAKRHLQTLYERSKQTGVPVVPDFFIRKVEYIEPILSFIEKVIPKKHPFSIDIIEPSLKIQTLEQLASRKLLPRTIYNSIHIGMTKEENEALRTYTPEAAILVAFNPKDKSPDGKIEVLENGAHLMEVGLLETARQIGIEKLLIDTAALAPGENSGAAIAALPVIKEEYGLPTGCAIHNVVEKSRWLNDFPLAKKTVDVASNNAIPLFGGNYAIFGPIENAELVIPLIAWQDILVSEYAENYFGVAPVESHPRRKLLK
jgi:tetrahydromethanopterin S-methyltransferase subunit H